MLYAAGGFASCVPRQPGLARGDSASLAVGRATCWSRRCSSPTRTPRSPTAARCTSPASPARSRRAAPGSRRAARSADHADRAHGEAHHRLTPKSAPDRGRARRRRRPERARHRRRRVQRLRRACRSSARRVPPSASPSRTRRGSRRSPTPTTTDPAVPQYVIVAMVEQGGFGANVAAPIVRRVIDFLNNPTPSPPPVVDRAAP